VTGQLAGLEGTPFFRCISSHNIISYLGYYPPSDTVEYTEDSPPSSANELTRLCIDWENSAELPEGCKTRLVKLRIGVVMGRTGGIIQQSIWPFWLGLGGKYLQFVVVAPIRSPPIMTALLFLPFTTLLNFLLQVTEFIHEE